MIKVTSYKKDFVTVQDLGEDIYTISWGLEGIMKSEYQKDKKGEFIKNELGNLILTGKLLPTEFATWYTDRLYYKPTMYSLMNMIKESGSVLNPSEIKSMAEFFGENPEKYVRDILMEAITRYDLSNEVNSLYLNDLKVWFDKVLRTSIERQIKARKNIGQLTAPIAFGVTILQIPVDSGLQMLELLEIYASDCYNLTLTHKAAILNMNLEDMLNYNYKTGYPEKLRFNL